MTDEEIEALQDEVIRLRRAVYTIFRAAKSSQYVANAPAYEFAQKCIITINANRKESNED